MTARRTPETAALRAEVARLRLQIASLPGLLWTADASGSLDFPGPQWPDYTGLPRARLQGAGWLEAVHPDDRPVARAAWETAVRSHAAFTLDYRLRRHDGVYRWFTVRAAQVRDSEGVLHWYGSCTDIDAFKQSRQALGEAERRYLALFNNRINGISHLRVITNARGTPVDLVYEGVNEAYERILGIPRREVEGRRITAVFPGIEDLEPDLIALFGNIARHGGEHSLEINFPITHQWFSTYVYSHAQDRCTLIFSDITAQKEAEAALQEAHQELEARVARRTAELEAANAALQREKERSRLVLETATDAYIACDGHGTISDWNRAAERLLGWSRAEILGRNLADTVIPPHASRHHHLNLEQFRSTGSSAVLNHVLELSARHRDGHDFPVDLALAANRFDDNWTISIFLRDASARKRAEAALTEAILEAEAAREKAEAASLAKSEFLATMSHEIRTPLNGVIGFNGLLLDGTLNEQQRRYAELARQSGEALLHLLNDFLDFSKIEAGHLELEPVAFDLNLEVGHVLSLIASAAELKQLTLSHRIAAPSRLRGDAARLRQILLNLLGNAVKFTERGTVSLCCEEVLRTRTHAWICFQVSDTGIGIDPSVHDRLFQPFVQADASTTRRFGGTGLGLAISKRLAEAMGGKIGYRSTPGQGSTFWVDLPFEPLAAEVVTRTGTGDSLPARPEGETRGRVLVVEDNPVSQLLAREIFQRLGFLVDVAGNGKEAVNAFRHLPYDLIFMDCDMPVMNGYDATCAIRTQAQAGEHVPIIAMTASVLQGDVERCISVGMDDFMSKPLRLQHISAMVDKWLHPARRSASIAELATGTPTAADALATDATLPPSPADNAPDHPGTAPRHKPRDKPDNHGDTG